MDKEQVEAYLEGEQDELSSDVKKEGTETAERLASILEEHTDGAIQALQEIKSEIQSDVARSNSDTDLESAMENIDNLIGGTREDLINSIRGLVGELEYYRDNNDFLDPELNASENYSSYV